MKKKLMRLCIFIFVLLASIIKAKALTYEDGFRTSQMIYSAYVKKERGDGYIQYKQMGILRKNSDGAFVYCLEPFTDIDNQYTYEMLDENYAQFLNIDPLIWEKINLLAYYGYEYKDEQVSHHDFKWYAVTQVLIWNTLYPEYDIYFTNTLNGQKDPYKYKEEIKELEALVKKHQVLPSLQWNSNEALKLGTTYSFVDSTQVLNQYSVIESSHIDARIEGDTLYLTPLEPKDGYVKLAKKGNLSTQPILFMSDYSQNILLRGNFAPLVYSASFSIQGGRVSLQKNDLDTQLNVALGSASLENALYGIYDKNDTLITTLKTNALGYALTDYELSFGEYYLKELESPLGYEKSLDIYSFVIDQNHLDISLDVYDKVIEKKIEINKFYEEAFTNNIKPEDNAVFQVYDKDNNHFGSIRTNAFGLGAITLPYGTYKIEQTEGKNNTKFIEVFYVDVKDSKKEVFSFVNPLLKAKVGIQKIDEETKEKIPIAGIEFQILDANHLPICQQVLYPNQELLCSFKTNSDGYFLLPLELPYGSYYLKEIESSVPITYQANTNLVPFTINENSHFKKLDDGSLLLDVSFENKRNLGTVNITKYGEQIVFDKKTFHYQNVILPNVKISVYANEDIFLGKKLLFKKDALVTTFLTEAISHTLYLEKGSYYLKEESSALGHIASSQKYFFTLDETSFTKDFTLYNELPKGSIKIIKKDIDTNEGIPNTLFALYTMDHQLVFEGLTNDLGILFIPNVFKGDFYIREVKAHPDYEIYSLQENVSITKENEQQEILFYNKKTAVLDATHETTIKVPNTQASIKGYFPSFIGLFSMIFILRQKKKLH